MAQTVYTVKKGDTLSGIGKNLGVDWRKITGYKSGDPNLIQPGEILNIPGTNDMEKPPISGGTYSYQAPTGAGSNEQIAKSLFDEITKRATGTTKETPETPQDVITSQLNENLTKYANAPTLTEEKTRLEEEKGVSKQKAIVGSFEDEVMKTQNLLDSLEEDITKRTQDYLVNESQRSRVYASEQAPLLKSLNISERGLTSAEKRLGATQSDILTELGLIEKEKSAPLDLLEREVNIRSKIKDLTTSNIPNIASTQFNDDGDLTIVTQDPTTGKIGTQTIKGIGKKASEYESYQTATNANGDFTIIGINRDGSVKELGTFKGVAKGAGEGTSPTSYKEWQLAGSPGTYADWLKEANVKAPTSAQQTVAEYAARIEQAEPTLESLESNIAGMNQLTYSATWDKPASFQSSEMQQYMQAARNFINAKLRRESGAVISPTEFSEARKQYLPQPGDSEETLKLKKQNRDLVFASLKKAAGNAYSSVSDLLGGSGGVSKDAVDSFYANADEKKQEMVDLLVKSGKTDDEILEYLKSKGFITQ